MTMHIKVKANQVNYLACCNARPVTRWLSSQPPLVQRKLTIGAVNDTYEREADRAAETVMRMQSPNACCQPGCAQTLQHQAANSATADNIPSSVHETLRSSGKPLDAETRAYLEPRFGHDFSQVRVHADTKAAESAQSVNALAYTVGRDVVFGAGTYAPSTHTGRQLVAHEMAHVVQQESDSIARDYIQRAVLTSPRLAGNQLFTDVLNNTEVIENGDTGPEVRRIQQLLIDLGYDFSGHGADGEFGSETETAVRAYQTDRGLSLQDGRVGFATIGALDADFPPFALPANRTAPWTMPCVLSILCPWNRHLVEDVLPGHNITTFTDLEVPKETWDGTAWVSGIFHAGGYQQGNNIGIKVPKTCQQFAETIYHEGWHAQQPSSLVGVVPTEADAYINTEQWTIAAGLPARTFVDRDTSATMSLRAPGVGETVVDTTAAEDLVRQRYGGVSSTPTERILSRVGATDVRVRRADGTEYTRPANPNESVIVGTPVPVSEVPIDPADWDCP